MSLRLSLFNPIDPARPVAERELALRFADAMSGLGWRAGIHHRSDEVQAFDPDAVLNLFPVAAPKMTEHPWLACAWGPPALLDGLTPADRARAAANELSHDAYLVSGEPLELYIRGRLAAAGRRAPIGPMHVSSPRSHRTPALGEQSRLFYVGSNWDGVRFPHLLSRLAEAGVLALHGAAARWSHLPDAYQGELPFDGRSVIDAAHRWGMGLCLHLPQHRADGVPNMRVFELAAAGALIVADRHPFIEQWFGDSVLYIDADGGEDAAAADILDRVGWVRANMSMARDMAAAAQEIFNRHLCLETLLAPLPDLLAELAPARRPCPAQGPVAVLLPEGDAWGERLAMLAGQRNAPLVTALVPQEAELPSVPPGLTVRRLPVQVDIDRLLSAMGDATALAVLPAGVAWQTSFLARMAAEMTGARAAMAAALWARPAGGTGFPIDPAETLALAPLSTGDAPAIALLRTAGLYCPAVLLRPMTLAAADWLSLALELPPALAGADAVKLLAMPGLRLTEPLQAGQPALRSWPLGGAAVPQRRYPRITGINDLSPQLAASLPQLWTPADFDRLPSQGDIWLYGAGHGGALVMAALPAVARARLRGVLDSRRQGTALGLPMRRPQDLGPAEMARATIIIAGQYVSDMLRVLQAGGAQPAHILNAYPYIADRVEAEEVQAAQGASSG